MPLAKVIGAGLSRARRSVVIASRPFLRHFPDRKALDALAGRRRVVALLHGIDEAALAAHSPWLAVAAIPGTTAARLVRLLRRVGPLECDDEPDGF